MLSNLGNASQVVLWVSISISIYFMPYFVAIWSLRFWYEKVEAQVNYILILDEDYRNMNWLFWQNGATQRYQKYLTEDQKDVSYNMKTFFGKTYIDTALKDALYLWKDTKGAQRRTRRFPDKVLPADLHNISCQLDNGMGRLETSLVDPAFPQYTLETPVKSNPLSTNSKSWSARFSVIWGS